MPQQVVTAVISMFQIADDEYFQTAIPNVSADTRKLLESRISLVQSLMKSERVSARSIRIRVEFDGTQYNILVKK
jgi:hypothetical protein